LTFGRICAATGVLHYRPEEAEVSGERRSSKLNEERIE